MIRFIFYTGNVYLMKRVNFNQENIIKSLEDRFQTYELFEKMILIHVQENYFSFVYQSLYNQLGYERLENNKFTSSKFKKLLTKNNFLDL